MKQIHNNTEKWRTTVSKELGIQKLPFPEDLVLAVIDVESSGVAGLKNPVSGASGLMQVMPVALNWYNKSHSLKYTMEDMRSKSNGPAQIRVGIWLIGQFWRSAYKYLSSRLATVPIDELAKIADLMYVAGPGTIRRLLNKLPNVSFDNFVNAYPNSDAYRHPNRVYDRFNTSQLSSDSILSWITMSPMSSFNDDKKKVG